MVLQCMYMGLKISENYLLGEWGGCQIFILVGGYIIGGGG